MSALGRWGRFNMVGLVGVAVQMCVLAMLNRIARLHYLANTALAVELTLLHNFAWHVAYTWRERASHAALWSALLRFQFSNGLVSLVGNVTLMRVLVRETHLPVLAANGIAIVCCSLANFCLGEKWVFATARLAD